MIFPEKFNGLYAPAGPAAFRHRPLVDLDLLFSRLTFLGRVPAYHAASALSLGRNEERPGAPPIKTGQGWLAIYDGVFQTMHGAVYRLGVALHDLENPAKILGVSDSWILQPEDPWELTEYVHNVVFTCGAVAEPDGTVKIYWGGADT